jgi:hypothetical protein
MKTTLIAAAAALSLVAATAAHAQDPSLETGSEAYPTPRSTGEFRRAAPTGVGTGSEAYPDLTGRPFWVVTVGSPDRVPMTGSEAGVETANSLPRGFAEGTVAYTQAQSLQRYVAQNAAGPTRQARTALAPNGKPRG